MSRREITHIKEENIYLFQCPHCDGTIIVNTNEVNCQIFRHGILKANGDQVNPHSSKGDCDYFTNNDMIYGCGRPFRFFKDNENLNWNYVDICDYI